MTIKKNTSQQILSSSNIIINSKENNNLNKEKKDNNKLENINNKLDNTEELYVQIKKLQEYNAIKNVELVKYKQKNKELER